MKTNEKYNVRRINAFYAIVIVAAMVLAMPTAVLADTEPNDDFNDAEFTYNGASITGTLNVASDQSDFYMIYLSNTNTLELELTGTGTNFDLIVYDASENEVDSSMSSGSTETISYESSDYGYYYIEVNAVSGSGSYTLEVDVSYSSTPIGDGAYYVGGSSYVSGQPLATLPTLNVGDSAYFGGIKDIGDEYTAQIDEALQQYEEMGMDVSYDISGGAGAYFGWEIASNNADVGGHTCYDIVLDGAIAINLGFEGSVDGSVSEGGYTVTVDGSADGFVEFEAVLEGHLYLTVDELAIAKLQFTITAEGQLEIHFDVNANMMGENMQMNMDATGSVDGVQLDFLLEFDPPLDIFQFCTGSGSTEGIYEGKEWCVPPVDTEASGSINALGTISYDYNMEMVGEEPEQDSDTVDLATEIGDNDYSETIPGGQNNGIMFECTYASGNIFVIETELGNAFGILGTRQLDDIEGMIPSAGMQYDMNKGMVTGMTVNGEAMTAPVTQPEVQSFTDDPLGEVTDETGGRSTGVGGILVLLVVVIIVVVVIVVVVMMLTKKRAPPQQQYPPQQMYQQPPPPPQQYPQQDQYGQQQYQQYPPPPPPPPGQ